VQFRTEEDSLVDTLDNLLTELEQFGCDNDRATAERPRKMLNITRDTGEFLAVLVRGTLARRVLEIGTSNGYSTLFLAVAPLAIALVSTVLEAVSPHGWDNATMQLAPALMAARLL
jgi:predicted O-methyltransferase YrrM